MQTDILIVGGGLSGLYLANQLEQAGRDYLLLEARGRFGGRIYSPSIDNTEDHFDMGPAWFWPGQTRMAKLLRELDISYFDQAARGKLVFEDPSGNIRRDLEMATMQGAHRVQGGLAKITDALVAQLSKERLHAGSKIHHVQLFDDGVRVMIEGKEDEILAQKVVLCMPPRLIEHRVKFSPPLPDQTSIQMRTCPTWMAAHAKFIAVYEIPFWREMELSGDAISHKGPMMELHDASPQGEDQDGGPGAVFGFLGVPADARKGQDASVIKACKQQLINLFGERASYPLEVFYKDWSDDELTATPMDANGSQSHPQYAPIKLQNGDWKNRLYFASTENAEQFGGLLEGALEAVEAVLKRDLT